MMSQGTMRAHLRYAGMSCLALLCQPLMAQPLALTVDAVGGGIFSGEDSHTAVTLSGERHTYARLLWELKAKGRVLSRGTQDVVFDEAETLSTTLPISTPPLRPGVSLRAMLSIEGLSAAGALPERLYRDEVTLYAPDVLQADREHYAQMPISLSDPVGRTAEIFDRLQIPYQRLPKSKLASASQEGLLVVGAGVRLERESSLGSLLLQRARRGGRVLLLQPASGTLPMKDTNAEAKSRPAEWWLSDETLWETPNGGEWPTHRQQGRRLALREYRHLPSLSVVAHEEGAWDWMGLRFKDPQGSLVVCMLPFTESVDGSPVVQLMLGKLLLLASEFASHRHNINQGYIR